MEEAQMDPSSTNACAAEKLMAEMDYSLLAVDMQKLLHISRTGVSDSKPTSKQVSNGRASIKMNEMEDIADHKCLFCTGNFTAKDSLSKHMLRIHHKDVICILSQYSSSHDYLKCPFCVYKLSEKHKKLFLLHLEKKHSFEFVESLKEHFSSSSQVPTETIGKVKGGSAASAETAKGTHSRPKLDSPFLVKAPPLQGKKSTPGTFGNRPISNSVRRRLQLDKFFKLQPTNQLFYLKENAPRMDEDSGIADLMWKKSTVKQFVCGSCREAFSYNAYLLDHINISHRGPLKLVQPLYHCGLCTATFFQNKFLVRHCFHHHNPL